MFRRQRLKEFTDEKERLSSYMDIYRSIQDAKLHQLLPFVLLYIGPETMLPLASALAAVGGVLLLFGQRFIGLIRKFWRIMVRKNR